MPTAKLASIRLKLSAAFTAVSLVMVALVIGALSMQLETVERAAKVEAERIVGAVAYAGNDNALSTPEYLQAYVEREHALNGRDYVFVDSGRKGIADSDKTELGAIFTHDPGGEVALTIGDGQARTFVEQNEHHPQGIKQIVIPLRKSLADAASTIVGAAIVEYGDIYDDLIAKERTRLLVLGAAGIGSVLLTMFIGLRLASKLAERLKNLQDGAKVIAAGNYGATVPITSRDEVGMLGRAFNTMAATLKSSRDLLEERVASRTQDLTQANIGIKRLNRVYAVLSGINTAIVRIRDRTELFEEVCRVASEVGQFGAVWIGVVDRDAMRVKPVAWRASEAGVKQLLEANFSVRADTPDGQSIVADAVRTKQAVVANEVRSDPRILRKEGLAALDIRSVAVLPLLLGNETAGVLALHSPEAGFFDAEEMTLLHELAGDIAFALDHIEKENKLEYLAYYDPLTGLANRSLFLERVAQHMRSAIGGGHKLALFLIDLERFRNINDTLGRPAGDALLKQVAEWLARDSGDVNLVARVGADHFAVVLPQVRPGHGAQSLEKSLSAFLEHPFRLHDVVFRIAVKIGVATCPDDGADADTLFRNAEAALKSAKARGERYVFYTQALNERVAEKLDLENQLRQALEKKEFVLHYQPKVDLATGKLTGCEALIRWNDPRTGLVPPGRFIPILEETGMIHEIGRWALGQAIADYLRWRAAGLPAVRIAVNVSPLQLRNRGFIEEIKQVIGIDAAAAAGLELEITESLIMEDVKHSIASLKAIRDMGVTIAIDDFGTGFSSLSYLAKLPVDTLKIDRSFVVDMTAGPDGLALVSTIINLAQSLSLKVVAEGVETEEQSRLLHLLRCNEMQGFLFSKPVPFEIFQAKFLAPLVELKPAA